ncbi:molybdopterin-containing oxidoreductase family protein [Maritalea sp.]|uniref:molybdopterin-containing oxidoreductase family protein n=1 Tax=Maritalea sp. TaxID=2003361 RepID=UPI003EF5FCBC
MNKPIPREIARSVCPHDCPSTCALDVEIIDDNTIGRVRGAKDDPYTAGVICEKVARYAERVHHPDRLLHPLKRVGAKGEGNWQRVSWDEALDDIATRFLEIEDEFGAEAIWPYNYAGTMGHVMRDGLERLRNSKGYSRQYGTICSMISWAGFVTGTGKLMGVNPEEMAKSDVVVIWGTNPVHTQVNVMTHAMRARKERGAKIVVVDIYNTATMQQADIGLIVRPGTDGALACAIMHILLRDGLADREYMSKFTDFSEEFESHLKDKIPDWAANITGLDVAQIEEFAALVGQNKKSFFRLGYGFTRQRNGAVAMHAALSIPAMTGAWLKEGGGAFHSNSGTWDLDKTDLEGKDLRATPTRLLDMCEIGPILTGDTKALKSNVPVKALLVQNTNPVVVAPDQDKVRNGFMRDDLFTVVHEQFMTDTAKLADYVLPATMFLEHNDYYTRGGHTRILNGPKLINAPGEAQSNHWLFAQLAKRLDSSSAFFEMSDRELIDHTFKASQIEGTSEFETTGFVDKERHADAAHYRDGFAWGDGKYRFAPIWEETRKTKGVEWVCDPAIMPKFADHWDVNEACDERHPFRLATSPARAFLNSSFNETPGSQKREGTPKAHVHPKDAAALNIAEGEVIQIGNARGQVTLFAKLFDGIQTGVLIVEGLHPNSAHSDQIGINTLIGSDPVPPFGGAAFHDCAVWVRKAE